ncbi:F-box/FBD/LRR-repeat protein At1g78750-like isoform X1 [Papaver somniferum]|uniref:F-box/FBD/LRR-repeat protein At1g78750-like isoform X1 n=2 Tax=Papaver somniferum TaxID=3469 RepID=UPI000E702239|nr:F-box/FBD/LRR-repeat protein At1g78750-like isoform X1 [Papaver somniferum]
MHIICSTRNVRGEEKITESKQFTLKSKVTLYSEKYMDRRVDWISILPDPLLHHILSFLDTKCAIRTSILSKRWKYIWTSIPNFDFLNWRGADYHLDVESDNKKFVNFMDGMIRLRDMSHMRKFYLKCDESSNGFRINSWISAVISRKVEELILILEADEPDEIPPSLFTCGPLVSLELQLPNLYLRLPNCISFPRLKVLRLFGINFRDDLLTEQLFSSCPILEDLIMRDCTWLYMENLCISAPALKLGD